MSDPRYTDPRFSEPVLRRDDSVGAMWGWIAGLAALALVLFLLIAGWHHDSTTASNNPSATTGAATHPITPPSTTGQGSATPSPLMPAPAKSGTKTGTQ
jgi:type VI protein secretion system component VasK